MKIPKEIQIKPGRLDRCGTIVMGHRCVKRENHDGNCLFKNFVPPSERAKNESPKSNS